MTQQMQDQLRELDITTISYFRMLLRMTTEQRKEAGYTSDSEILAALRTRLKRHSNEVLTIVGDDDEN